MRRGADKEAQGERRFYVWTPIPADNACTLTYLNGVEDYRLFDEAPLLGSLKKKLTMDMNPKRPRNVRLIDAIEYPGIIVASKRLRELLERFEPEGIEFLPLTIRNHKKRVASTEYCIVHGAEALDCLDLKRSKPEYHFIEKKKLRLVEQLIIDPARVPARTHMFRIHGWVYPLWVVDDVLKNAIEEAKIEGVFFVPAERWPKFDDEG